jgi:CBS domain-containing protein
MARLADIMTSEVFTTGPSTSVAEVAAAMVRRRIGSAVVSQGPVVAGIFTERDVLRAAGSGADLKESPVSRWMTSDPETAGPDLDSERAIEIMVAGGFRHLPVMEGDTLVGIVSLRDVFSAGVHRRDA